MRTASPRHGTRGPFLFVSALSASDIEARLGGGFEQLQDTDLLQKK